MTSTKISFEIATEISSSLRANQVCSMFDAPLADKCSRSFEIDFPYDAEPWNVGLVVGPSGSGKSTVMGHVWGEPKPLRWDGAGIIDDFDSKYSVEQIANAIGSVGFSTPPAWLRPHRVLSMGEQFRTEIARRVLSDEDPIVVDEYTSVVDRQVAQVASHAIQRYIRKEKRKFVAVGCHYDVIDWLQPDWILDMATQSFTRRLLQRRPAIKCTIGRLPRAAWGSFAPFHYMSAQLPSSCHGFGLWANGVLACSLWVAVFPHPTAKDIIRVARVVTLPDYQGLGLAFTLLNSMGAALKAGGRRLRNYPAHPSFIEAHKTKSAEWKMIHDQSFGPEATGQMKGGGDRFVGVFEYIGPANARFATTLGVTRGLKDEDDPASAITTAPVQEKIEKPLASAIPIRQTLSPTERLVDYVQQISPEYAPPYHLEDLCAEFERARLCLMGLSEDVVRTLDTEPIRHYKTETMLHGILWLMEWCPWARFVLMTYSHKRAQWLGKRLRDLARRTNVKPAKGWDTIDYWQNEIGGGVAVMSADMSTEGYDCHALFCDDPIDEHKSDVAEKREEVDRSIAYYTARCTRKGRPGPVLIVMSRFHPDDPIGRRQMREGWKQIYHPAIIDLDGPTERAFAPEILDLKELKRIRKEEAERDPTERVFWARFQGQPRTPGGDFFKEPMRYDAEAFPQWPGFRDVIGLDMAYSTSKLADWSAMVVLRVYEGKSYVRDAVRVKLDPDLIEATLRHLQSTYGASQIYSYVSGPEVGTVKELRRKGLRVTAMPARYNKLVRAQRTRAAWNAGAILLPDQATWAPGLIATALDFRGLESDDDDLIDALVSACDGAMFRGAGTPKSLGAPRI